MAAVKDDSEAQAFVDTTLGRRVEMVRRHDAPIPAERDIRGQIIRTYWEIAVGPGVPRHPSGFGARGFVVKVDARELRRPSGLRALRYSVCDDNSPVSSQTVRAFLRALWLLVDDGQVQR